MEKGNAGLGIAIVLGIIAFMFCLGPFIIALFALIFSSDAGVLIFILILVTGLFIGSLYAKAN